MEHKNLVWDWPHAPLHRLSDAGAYIVTAGTYTKAHYFRDSTRLEFLTRTLLDLRRNTDGISRLGQFSRTIITLWRNLLLGNR